MTHMRLPRVLLADDHVLVLNAMAKFLEEDCVIVGEISDGWTVVPAVERLQPDIVLLDIGMPQVDGLTLARQIRITSPAVRLVFLTMYEDPEMVVDAFRNGASAYVLKRSAVAELSHAIREVMEGRQYITPLLADHLVAALHDGSELRTPILTDRQKDVVRLLVRGLSMKETAAALNVSARTVAFHKYQAMAELNIKSTAELIQYAVKHHIV